MPRTRLILYRETDGSVPVLDWLAGIPPKARAKCRVRLERLAELGHEMRRPEADYLRDGVHELRAMHSGVNYRMLFFFFASETVVVSQGFSKQQARVRSSEIEIALRRKRAFESAPSTHSHEEAL